MVRLRFDFVSVVLDDYDGGYTFILAGGAAVGVGALVMLARGGVASARVGCGAGLLEAGGAVVAGYDFGWFGAGAAHVEYNGLLMV